MRIKSVSIQNFKCFEERIDLEFGKLTLLTGANSSGKSSIIYSVLGAIQSGEFPLQFSTNGKYVDMGDFKEIVYNHDTNKNIEICLTLDYDFGAYTVKSLWEEDKINSLPTLNTLWVHSPNNTLSIIKQEKGGFIVSYDDNKWEEIDTVADILDRNPEELSYVPIVVFNRYDENINFIGSFRLQPQRTYLEQAKSRIKINSLGEGYLDQIMIWETKDKNKFNELMSILKELNLLESIKSKRFGGGRYEIAVQVKENGVDSSLSDVGFGVSQFLPVIVADLQLSRESTLYISQPEIHLHPSVQSAFGGYLVKQINSQAKNYVIETHSEYLLNRIRLAIVKGEIKEDEVKVYFTDNSTKKSVLHEIHFNKQGQILNAPSNFFKTYMMDVMEIAINAAE
ncbi:hypothetical protein EZS27_008123 [termite gut metagenome]|uniref:Endonuclease GajA/Old nuclease/RecF-like AAA domain-containing protein n=1 Tax=termite gut metagenome TaxID=433724 RepID=A0A5J4SG04_9ZZZZ